MGIHLPSMQVRRRGARRVLLVVPMVTLGIGATAGVPSSGALPSPSEPVAVAAKVLFLNVTTNLHLVSRSGHTLIHQGSTSGNLSGAIYTHSVALSTSRGEGTFTFYPKGGSISGRASTRGHVVGATLYFTGTATITGGTGKWAHASGSGLQYSGVMNRQNFHVTEHFSGNIRY